MNSFIESLNLWGERFLEYAVPMIWQSSLLIALIFVLDFALRRKVRSAVRYALWFVVLLKLLLPPTLALPTGAAWWLRGSKPNAPVPRRILTVSYPEPVDEAPRPAITIPAPPPPTPQLSAAAWMLLASSVGSLILLTWLLARWRQIARHIRQASPAPAQIVELFNQIIYETRSRSHGSRSSRRESAPSSRHEPSQSGLTSAATRFINAQIRLVRHPISPAVCGLFRPIILLPQTLVEKLSPAQLRAVLLHELIHLRRRDVWMNCFQTFLQVAYWWHPLLWLANARIRRLREESVDDAVMLALNENSEVYAPTLLEVAKLAFNRPLASLGLVGILESKNALRQRIERLLNFTTPGRAGLSIMSVVCIAAFTAIAVPMGEAPPRSSDPGAGLDSTNLIAYHTKVDPEVFIRNIRARASETMHTTNDPWGDILLSILDGYGCSPPRGLALNNQTGELTTQNTSEALQVLDQVINELNLPGGERILNPSYGLKQVLIEAQFYQMKPEQFARIDLDSAYRNRDRNSSPSWQLTSNQVNQVTQSIKQLGLQPFSSPRIQTSHGGEADLFQGDKTNSIELECLPFIRDGAVDLTVVARTSGEHAPPGGWPDFAGRTNCAIFSRVGFEDGGGVVLQAQSSETEPQSNLVVLLRARIIQHSPTAANRSATRENISPQRQKIYDKLNATVIDKFRYPNLPLAEVVRILIDQAKLHDPAHEGINFIMNQAPAPRPTSPPIQLGEVNINLDPGRNNIHLADALSDIVRSADHPIKYSILDFGVEFSFGNPESSTEPPESEVSATTPADVSRTDKQQRIYRLMFDLKFDMIGLPGLSLSEVASNLTEIVKRRDPTHEGINFFINETSATNGASSGPDEVTISLDPPLAHVRLIDVLQAMVNTADHPIKFTVQDNGVEFSLAQRNPPELITRTFKLAPNRLTNLLQSRRIKYDTLDSQAALKFLELFGVRVVPPESCSYDAQNGLLTVHATQNDMYELTTDDGLVPLLGIDLNTSLQEGKLLFERGKLDEAEARFQEVLQRDPENQTAHYYLDLIKDVRKKANGAPVENHPELDIKPRFIEVAAARSSESSEADEAKGSRPDSSNLETRTFQLDPNTFYLNLQKTTGVPMLVLRTAATHGGIRYVSVTDRESPKAEIERALIQFFHDAAVDLSPPKSVSFDNAHCALTVHATRHDLKFIEAAVNTLGVAPPQVNIKTRFVEFQPDSDWSQQFDWYPKAIATNGSFIAVLSDSQFKAVLQEIENRHGADLLNEGQVTTLSGRQAQFADVEVEAIPTNTVGDGANNRSASPSKSAGIQNAGITERFADPFGTTLDVVGSVSDNGSTIQMNTIVTTTEFTGYESPEMPMYGDPPKLTQPHCRVRQFTESHTIPDGATIALSGPGSTQTNNLVIFVTPTVIDASGNRIHSQDYYDGPVQ